MVEFYLEFSSSLTPHHLQYDWDCYHYYHHFHHVPSQFWSFRCHCFYFPQAIIAAAAEVSRNSREQHTFLHDIYIEHLWYPCFITNVCFFGIQL